MRLSKPCAEEGSCFSYPSTDVAASRLHNSKNGRMTSAKELQCLIKSCNV